MKPCDYIDDYRSMQLNEQGLSINGDSIQVRDGKVELRVGSCILFISLPFMKRISEWFLTDQELNEWRPIDTAPRDGRWVYVRFDNFGKQSAECFVVWGSLKKGWWMPGLEGRGEPLQPCSWNPNKPKGYRSLKDDFISY